MTLIIAEGKAPKKMTPRKPHPGMPTKLTAEAEAQILAACRNHQDLNVAASLAGIEQETFHSWLREAAKANEFIAKGGNPSDLTSYQKKCRRLTQEIRRAMDQAHAIALKGVIDAGLKRQTTVVRKHRYVGKNDEGQPIFADEEQVTETPPDPTHLKWWLERTHKRYVPKQSMEVTGADGGPVAIEYAARLEAIAAKIKSDPIPVESEEVE